MKDVCPHCGNNPIPPPIAVRLYSSQKDYIVAEKVSVTDYGHKISVQVEEKISVVGVGPIRPGHRTFSLALHNPHHVLPGDVLSFSGASTCHACKGEGTASAAMLRKIQGMWS